jgi:CheY-like chemotaxis protein
MSVSILVVDDEPDVAELFRQRLRREVRQGDYVLHFAASGEAAPEQLAGEIQPELIRQPVRYQHAGNGQTDAPARSSAASPICRS